MSHLPQSASAVMSTLIRALWPSSLLGVATTSAAIIAGLVLLHALYNRFFHPVAHIPGPLWGTISDFYKLFIVAQMDAHTRGLDMHRKYGPLVRVAPNLIAFDNPEWLPLVYHRQVDKTDFYSTGILGDIPPPFQTLKHADHAAKRKRVASAFSMNNLRKLEGNMDERIQEFITELREKFAKTGKPLDFANYAQWFVYDLVTQLGFGEPIGFVKQGKDVGGLIAAFHEMAPLAGVLAAVPWLLNPIFKNPIFKGFLMPRPGDSSGTGRIMAYRDQMIKARLDSRETGHGDFLDNLLMAKNADGTPMSIEEIKTECFVLMVAASDTTSAFICPFVHHVAHDKRVLDKLMAEIDDFERRGKLTSPVAMYDETLSMPYFMACVRETLRYSPSTPMIMPRMVSKGGLQLGETFIPAGTEIGSNPYVVHRNRKIFGEDADQFRPERWLDEDRARVMERHNQAWGYGTRICLGKNIAQLETQKLCLELFRQFTIQSPTPDKPWRAQNWAIEVYFDQWLNIAERPTASV